MSEDPTRDLTMDEKLNLILQRLAALEAQGANTTRPLLDQLIKEMVETREALTERIDSIEREMIQTRDKLTERIVAVEKELRSMNHQLEGVAVNWMKMQGAIREHAERLSDLESRPN